MFDTDPGEMFVVRNVAAMVPPFETTPGRHGVSAALEFAVQVLKSRKLSCLAMACAAAAKPRSTRACKAAEPGQGGFIADWIALLDEARGPVVAQYGTTGREAERAMEQAGVRTSLANLRTFPCVAHKEAAGKLRLTGAFFAISDGLLHVMDETTGVFSPIV